MWIPNSRTECRNYNVLSQPNRHQSFGLGQGTNSDGNLVPGWYLQSSSYSRMIDNCIQVHRCKTDITGWLKGGHPTFKDGIVDREACFHGWEKCCYRIVQIRVRECQTRHLKGGIATVQENERYQVLQFDSGNSGSYKRDFMSRKLCVRKLLMSLLIMI